MILVVALLVYFCLVGLIARRFGTGAKWLLLGGIVLLIMLDFVRRSLL